MTGNLPLSLLGKSCRREVQGDVCEGTALLERCGSSLSGYGLVQRIPIRRCRDACFNLADDLPTAAAICHYHDSVSFQPMHGQITAKSPVRPVVHEVPPFSPFLDRKPNGKP